MRPLVRAVRCVLALTPFAVAPVTVAPLAVALLAVTPSFAAEQEALWDEYNEYKNIILRQ